MTGTVYDEETQQRDLIVGLAPESQDVVVTCECNGTTEVCSDGTSTQNAEACVPEEVNVTCECNGATEVCSDGSSTENAEVCIQSPALTGPLLI